MAEKKAAKTAAKKAPAKGKVIEITKFFNVTREKEGVWYEPKINGIPLGLELKVLGPSAEAVRKASVEYDTAHEKADELFKKEPGKALDMEQEALAKRAAACVVDIRGKGGNTITVEGKPLEFSKEFAERLFFENGDITGDVLAASINSGLFK